MSNAQGAISVMYRHQILASNIASAVGIWWWGVEIGMED
jgi:hypothetical protein